MAITADGDSFPARVKADDKSRGRSATATPAAPTLRSDRCDHLGVPKNNGDYVCLEWDAPSNNPTVTGFEIQYNPSGGLGNTDEHLIGDTGNVLSFGLHTRRHIEAGRPLTYFELFLANAFRDSGASGHNDSRSFRVRAINAAGQSDWSNVVQPFR